MCRFTNYSLETTTLFHIISKNYMDMIIIKKLTKDIHNLKILYEEMTSEKGIEIQDFTFGEKVVKHSFIGSKAVDWFENFYKISRKSAVILGEHLIKVNIIQTPKSNPVFKDAQNYYKIYPIEKIQFTKFVDSSYHLDDDFKEDLEKSTRIFGVDPEFVIKRDKTELPIPFKEMIDYLMINGTNVKGIFREGGSHDRILLIILRYDLGLTVNLSEYTIVEIASCLKRYLKSLPEPLIPYDTFDQMIKLISQKEDDFTNHLAETIKPLSDLKKKILNSLFELLCKVSSKSDENNMVPKNLAVVMGFNILSPKNDDPLLLRDLTSKIIFVTEKMIELYPKYLE